LKNKFNDILKKPNIQQYHGDKLNHIAFPLGGIGAGMLCIEGTGAFSHFSLKHKPEIPNQQFVFSSLTIENKTENIVKILEGPVPGWKYFGMATPPAGSGGGSKGTNFGLPRFAESIFASQFPFAWMNLQDPDCPLNILVEAWSPFIPHNSKDSSLPTAILEYYFQNPTNKTVKGTYAFNSKNFLSNNAENSIKITSNGYILKGSDKDIPSGVEFSISILEKGTSTISWFDDIYQSERIAWENLKNTDNTFKKSPGEIIKNPGASVLLPLKILPQSQKKVTVILSWHCPKAIIPTLSTSEIPASNSQNFIPWYSQVFKNAEEVQNYTKLNYKQLKKDSEKFTKSFYDSSLPNEIINSIGRNLSILKSPTLLRQKDGKLWAFEGCNDNSGCCPGSCTHVWNYAQAIAHLFPELEKTLREQEFFFGQNNKGHQSFRIPLTESKVNHETMPAADGQLGGIILVHRDWKINGDIIWLKKLWPKIKKSLDYCIQTWDPDETGILTEPQHNTFDIEFWGPNGMCTSIYLTALKAFINMSLHLNKNTKRYEILLKKGIAKCEKELFNGEYFFQEIQWEELKAENPITFGKKLQAKQKKLNLRFYSKEAENIFYKEGPKYQYGNGCLSNGILGEWLGLVSGLDNILSKQKIKSHLKSVFKYNFFANLSSNVNTMRPTYGLGTESGLLICNWPKGKRPTIPFMYSDEIWTGIEYQAASHMLSLGMKNECMSIIKGIINRYNGQYRNPFDEYECGHWYGRALSSYALLQTYTGIRFDNVTKTLYGNFHKNNFKSFIAADSGFGNLIVTNGKPILKIVKGTIKIKKIIDTTLGELQ